MSKFHQFILLMLVMVITCNFCGCQLATSSKSVISSKILPTVATHIVKHALGKTEIPIHPQRVVALDPLILEIPLALGVKLVGAPATYLHELDLQQQISDIADIGWLPSIEKVIALKPDLLLGSIDQNRDTYNLWSQVAPTMLMEMEGNGDWKAPFMEIAVGLGKVDTAQGIINKYHVRLAEFKAQMGDRLRQTKVSVIRINPPSNINLLTQDLFSGVILEDAGLSRPRFQKVSGKVNKKRKSGSSVGLTISRELINLADGNIIFIIAANSFKNRIEFQKVLQQIQEEPLWLKLQAVQKGKVYVVGQYWLSGSYLSADRVLDDLFKYLVK